ncbi:alpha-2-macroglobulin isoform X3 [Alligator mississippiensis]|uniref:Alpha-2-macroglobulin-like protein 1 n=1 Tax=Alligator mississippiensis TaxID=8496 RepID=A0A151P6E2_ALLMI|nr:alpha-2-macroglobulin isoform X3 [Alligator mississippiensis]KYO44636.1 alpha-2-macroglobulin-like protein 1 [Alligator mississippiensis]
MAYILLAHLSQPEVTTSDITKLSPILRQFNQRCNSFGGFYSTQDTVVGFQALIKYAGLTYWKAGHTKVMVRSEEALLLEFHVDGKNQLVLQQAPLLGIPGVYTVQEAGSGCVYVQTTLSYNVPPHKSEAVFVLHVETAPVECNDAARKHFDLHVAVSYTGNRRSSNMALIEVKMLSGFIPVKSSVKALQKIPIVKRTEVDPEKVTIYLEELDKTLQNFTFSVEQEIEVQHLKPATVHVYDYYQPDDHATAEYNAPCSSEIKKEDSH